jgi:hypothetical protein
MGLSDRNPAFTTYDLLSISISEEEILSISKMINVSETPLRIAQLSCQEQLCVRDALEDILEASVHDWTSMSTLTAYPWLTFLLSWDHDQ